MSNEPRPSDRQRLGRRVLSVANLSDVRLGHQSPSSPNMIGSLQEIDRQHLRLRCRRMTPRYVLGTNHSQIAENWRLPPLPADELFAFRIHRSLRPFFAAPGV